jgi:hypothetical protein
MVLDIGIEVKSILAARTPQIRQKLTFATAVVVLLGAGGDPPHFRSSVTRIDPAAAARMTSWHRGCPVAVGDLSLVTLTYWGFDRRVHQGRLVVGRRSAPAIVGALRAVFKARFPIRRMQPVEAYGADDDRSMAADNTSAFNCRRVEGTRSWSEHAYGRAIDINPLENPELLGGRVLPPAGARYADRTRRAKGMIHPGDAVVRAFASVGWHWGGYWRAPKDYQHFSATGR